MKQVAIASAMLAAAPAPATVPLPLARHGIWEVLGVPVDWPHSDREVYRAQAFGAHRQVRWMVTLDQAGWVVETISLIQPFCGRRAAVHGAGKQPSVTQLIKILSEQMSHLSDCLPQGETVAALSVRLEGSRADIGRSISSIWNAATASKRK